MGKGNQKILRLFIYAILIIFIALTTFFSIVITGLNTINEALLTILNEEKLYHNGRRVSKGEKYIAQYLDKYNISYTQEQTFEDCVNFYGNHLRFDFYLEQFNLLIEYQGHHHEKPINKYKRARIAHEKQFCTINLKE